MKIIAGWLVALAMIAGTGTAIALSVKPQRTLSEERCVGLSCWPEQPATSMDQRGGRHSRRFASVPESL